MNIHNNDYYKKGTYIITLFKFLLIIVKWFFIIAFGFIYFILKLINDLANR